MKFRFFIFLIIIFNVQGHQNSSIDFNQYVEDENHLDYLEIPQVNGTFSKVSKKEIKRQLTMFTAEYKSGNTDFFLCTNDRPLCDQLISNDNISLPTSTFNPRNPTRFIIHGWFGGKDSVYNHIIKEAYFNRGNYNIFIADWSLYAKNPNYIYARSKVPEVGKNVAEFIDYLHQFGRMQFKTLYLIGFSLGGHVVGLAGKNFEKGRANTIIGLDPASVLFSSKYPEHRLAVTDAEYVESIHTNSQLFGFKKPLGNASFYPNWGEWQPGCTIFNDLTGSCSHNRAVELFVESISDYNRFVPIECVNYNEIVDHNCSGDLKIKLKMGGEPSNYGQQNNGIYYLPTNSEEPYGVGIESTFV